MPLKDAPASQGSKSQIEIFKKACSELWPNARRLQVHRKASPKKVLRDPAVVHVKNADGSILDDSTTCIDELVQAIDIDVEKNSPGEYRLALIGVQELPIKGRKKTVGEPEIELKGTGWIRFGDEGEDGDGDEAGSVRGILRETAKMVSSVSTAVGNIANASNVATTGVESVVEMQRKVIETQAGAFTAVASVEQKHAETNLAIKTIEIQHTQWMFDQEQKERRYQEEREERQKQRAEDERQKREFMEKGLAALMGLVTTVAEDRKAERAAREASEARARGETPKEPPPRAEPPPPNNTVAPSLAAAIAHLTPEQHEQLAEIFGRTTATKIGTNMHSHAVWDLIVGASKQKTDEEAINTLRNIGTDIAPQINAAARKSVEELLLEAPQAQAILDAYRRIA